MKRIEGTGGDRYMGQSRNSTGFHAADKGLTVQKKNKSDIIVALAGNPNVGKSTVFNVMTGLNQHTGNWPGKTVTNAQGYCTKDGQGYVMVDIPGCYSLSARSAEEEVAGDFIRSGIPDVVVVVCDAVCLERNLNLVLQIMDETPDVVVCVNLMDEAEKKHIRLELQLLQERLGTPVIGAAARNREGIDEIYEAVKEVKDRADLREREKTAGTGGKREEAGEIKGEAEKREGKNRTEAEPDTESYIRRAEEICRGAVWFENESYAAGDRKKDRIFTGKFTAFPVMFFFLLVVFWLTVVGANYPSELLHAGLFRIEGGLMRLCIRAGIPEFLREMLVHGVYRVVAWVVSVMLPPMAIFFPLFTVLEDSGYLPRVAYNLDRCFIKCRACGKQALTMCMGFPNLLTQQNAYPLSIQDNSFYELGQTCPFFRQAAPGGQQGKTIVKCNDFLFWLIIFL